MSYEESIVICRPLARVFSYMDDIFREPEWQPNLQEVEQIPEGPQGVGTTRRYVSEFLGRRFENIYVNTVYEPNARVAYESKPGSDLQASGEIRWEAVDGGTKVTMQVEPRPTGFLKLMPRGMRDPLYAKELKATLRRLKAQLESGV